MTALPDKWIRKAIYERIHNIDMDGNIVPCFDTRVSKGNPDHYILMTTQTNNPKGNKCKNGWYSSILLDVVTRFSLAGNAGSRLLADNIADEILIELEDLSLDAESNMSINTMEVSFPNDLSSATDAENIFRKLIRYEFTIN